MMAFKPVNSDHSVSAASFQLVFSAPFTGEFIQAVKANADRWQRSLPALTVPQVIQFQIAPGAQPESNIRPGDGLEFAFLRPDGTPAWVMRVLGNSVMVECSRYTRWRSVFAQASGYLRDLIEVAAIVDIDMTINQQVLVVVDDFFWFGDRSEYALDQLFRPNAMLAEVVFKVGPVWHSNTAWFEHDAEREGDQLILLNVSGSHSDPVSEARKASARVNVTIMQDFRRPWSVGQLTKGFDDIFTGVFETMHSRNKTILQEILVSDAAKEIGLS